VTYEIRVFFEGAQKEVFSSILKKHYNYTKAWKLAFLSSIFKYFFKSPKKHIIRVCLNILRVCHYYGSMTFVENWVVIMDFFYYK
jgi:NADH:ubiquinone oxidoreductase subunit E